MPPIVYIGPALIGALLFYVFRLDNKKKKAVKELQMKYMLEQAEKRTAEANIEKSRPTDNQRVEKSPPKVESPKTASKSGVTEIHYETPSYREVKKVRAEQNLNTTFKFDIAGTQVKKYRKFFELEAHDYMLVDIVPEPTNKHDKDALAVKYMGTVIGYVPSRSIKGVKKVLENEKTNIYIMYIKWRYDSNRDYEYLDVTIGIDYHFAKLDVTL